MTSNFWQKISKPFFTLAPMADVTDWPFRQVVAKCRRPDVFYTEFVSADGLVSDKGREKLLPLLYFTGDEHPIVAQIFGAQPENIYKAAQLVREFGFDGLDINMGCPDRKVMKQGAGIALCKTPELAAEIISAAKEGSGLPVSIKTRLGYSSISMDWIEKLLDNNLSALAVHLRTMKEVSKVSAHWEIAEQLAQLAHAKNTLIICNGDVMTRQDGIEKAQKYNLDGIMIGRGIFYNPWFFNPVSRINLETIMDKSGRLALLKKHTELFVEFWSRPPFSPEQLGRNFDVLKKFYKMYVTGWDGAKKLRTKLMECQGALEVLGILKGPLTCEP